MIKEKLMTVASFDKIPEIITTKDKTCIFCGKTFRKFADCARHLVTHTGERPYTCEFCQKSFKQKKSCKKSYPCGPFKKRKKAQSWIENGYHN